MRRARPRSGAPSRQLSSPHAALVNGTQVQGFELDDVHRTAVLHVGAVTLPPLFAVAESHAGCPAADFLTAAVAGYEIGPRVGLCMGQEHIGQGWHSGATVGVFSAAAGAARALQLPADATSARARHRRHAIVRPDGGAIRRHGQAHACRPRRAKRALRGVTGEPRLHRHRRRVRGALRRLLHDILAFAGSLRSHAIERRARRALRNDADFAQILFLRRLQRTPRSTPFAISASVARSRPTTSITSSCMRRRSRSIMPAGRTSPKA